VRGKERLEGKREPDLNSVSNRKYSRILNQCPLTPSEVTVYIQEFTQVLPNFVVSIERSANCNKTNRRKIIISFQRQNIGRDPSWVEKVPENTLYPGRGSKG
jgi:hypothetical protein